MPSSAAPHHICLPFESEAQYARCLRDLPLYRQFLQEQFQAHPELFPQAFARGWQFHSHYQLKKQAGLKVRRLRLNQSREVFTLRPSFLMPYGIAYTTEVEKALYLRQFGVPFDALVYVFGQNTSFWERAWLSFSRPSLVGTTIKDVEKLPRHLTADEKVSWLSGQEVYLTTTVGEGCFLGVGLATEVTAEALAAGYGEFKAEAQALDSTYAPETVCTDGFRATRLAWRQLFPTVALILCYLHGVIKIRDRCRGELRRRVLNRVWRCYEAVSVRQFRQRLRRLHEWATRSLTGPLQQMVVKLWEQGAQYKVAYAHPEGHRTSNAVDRLMRQQERLLTQMRSLHGGVEAGRRATRAQALLWNFHPYHGRLREGPTRRHSPFADLNGFEYHANWLENLLIAASLGGQKL
jgi:hypothetical protein